MPRVHLWRELAQRRTFSLDTWADIIAERRHHISALEPPWRYIISPPFTSPPSPQSRLRCSSRRIQRGIERRAGIGEKRRGLAPSTK